MRLLPGIRCSVGGLPDAFLWGPSAGETQHVSLVCEAREARESVEVRRMGTGKMDRERENGLPHTTWLWTRNHVCNHVYVCDGDDRVQVFTKSGHGQADGEFNCPHGGL
jgi:hypothetical protein